MSSPHRPLLHHLPTIHNAAERQTDRQTTDKAIGIGHLCYSIGGLKTLPTPLSRILYEIYIPKFPPKMKILHLFFQFVSAYGDSPQIPVRGSRSGHRWGVLSPAEVLHRSDSRGAVTPVKDFRVLTFSMKFTPMLNDFVIKCHVLPQRFVSWH